MVDDVYLDDNERAERVKQWWKDNGLSIVGGAALGLAAIFGWREWQSYQQAHSSAAATAYGQLQTQAQSLSVEEIDARMDTFRTDFGDTPYAAMAALEGAVLYYRAGEPEKAVSLYEYAIAEGEPGEVRDIARLRLARLQMDIGDHEQALAALGGVRDGSYESLVDEIRGDVLVRMGRVDEARDAYQSARDGADQATTGQLDLKISSLGSGIVSPGDDS